MIQSVTRTIVLSLILGAVGFAQPGAPPLRLAIAGLVHSHVDGFLHSIRDRTDVQVVAVFEPNLEVQHKYAKLYHLDDSIFSTDLGAMLDRAKPDAVATFTSTFDHPMVVEACAQRHIPVMMEKPLAVSMEHARSIQRSAAAGKIPVVINYETTWYRSHGKMWDLIKQQRAAGQIRKMVAMDGHEGPQEIHVPPEFFEWLTDPVKNGAGALFDFGCYGANLMTWMMDNQRPLAVTAITSRFKPKIYPRVDDEASILVEYPTAQGIIQGSWNWPFSRKDFEVYGERGYAIAVGGSMLKVRMPGQRDEETHATLDPLPTDERDPVEYLAAVARGKRKPSGLSSLENNMIVVEILAAARESAATGKTIKLANQ
jgi:predicted dehydrogenase